MRLGRWVCLIVVAACSSLHGSLLAEEVGGPSATRLAWLAKAQSSSDLRLRLAFASFPVLDAHGKVLHQHMPIRDLLEAARGSTDPLVLQLLLARCRTATRRDAACNDLDLARRWIQAETQNQAAWIAYATVLEASGDLPRAEEAWQSAARSSTYRDGFSAVVRTIVQAMPADEDPKRRYQDLVAAFGIAAAIPGPDLQDAYRGCKVATRRESCARIADVMFRDADNLLVLMIAKWIGSYTGQPDDLVRAREERVRAMQWAVMEMGKDRNDPDAIETGGPQAAVAANAAIEALARRGELASAQDFLTLHHLSVAEAALRHAGWPAKVNTPAR